MGLGAGASVDDIFFKKVVFGLGAGGWGLGPVWTAENTKVRHTGTPLEIQNLTLPPQTPPGDVLNQDPRCAVGKNTRVELNEQQTIKG